MASIGDILENVGGEFDLKPLTGDVGLSRTIDVPRIQKPGLALTGYKEQLHNGRMLVLGATEMEYLSGISEEEQAKGVQTMLESQPATIVVTRGLSVPDSMVQACKNESVSLLVSGLSSPDFIVGITRYLQETMADSVSVHGVLVDVLGVGTLLLGSSGIGKSETALDLVVRGHRFVADDVIELRRLGKKIMGQGSGLIGHHMEIRGLGIINIEDLYGISAVRKTKHLDMVIELQEWDDDENYDRIGAEDFFYDILGVKLPFQRIPVRPGRTNAILVEVSARNHLLKMQGHHSAKQFESRLHDALDAERKKGEG